MIAQAQNKDGMVPRRHRQIVFGNSSKRHAILDIPQPLRAAD
jgi:hypothetical protein